ncbi:FtsK/SpoIIIE domain-containing protein [[Ruminococcus] gnavus]|jgi:hypothetical protein|uniref:FtsK/SpoIIIE domain-containing protein n=1 Tax=Mediterraneibacter gnavus TaxID=33038 RepID=A0AB35J580_MEDGN|nr:FtsK/SpoIIIE domain-containing protein [Mediterraneibacter gnavus]MDB8726871.1 FtsK/SpoIIIE domain-containing protein [Mediterraneibacter gnavus]MDB8730128.1 FtsK/SpoIIIE domain-containing protein [Mediterraneibacter gnavus]MDB8733471.1 FtsK/SpoIIIE domain-containing protein [Mediterraneibacter gnavus]MDB8739409.1 FtsK/SpoIIIE domain-containing protein [Mediterraneibacter gnavus]
MTMNRIQTDRQMKSTVTVIILALCVVFSMLFSYVKDFPLKILLLCTTAVIMLILSFALLGWAVRNQIDRGLKYAWKHYVLVLRLRKELLDAGIYTTRKIGVEKVAVIPWVTVDFAPDFRSGRVYIKNSIQFHDKLAKIDISSALGGYVVEQAYLTDDAEHYYFDFYDARYDKRLVFHNFGEFKAYSDSVGDYELFIDRDTTLPLTHQLLVGQTGSGKSYALFGYILQMYEKQIPYNLYFADPKESSIALLGERISPDNTASDFDEIVALLEHFVSGMEERQAEIKERLSTMIDGDYRDFGLSPHLLIFDEFSAFSQRLAEKDKKQRDHVSSLLAQIVLKGRQSGFFLWIVMQQSGSNSIPTFIRDNLPWKVVLGNAEDQTYVTAFGAGTDIPLRKLGVGEGVFTYPTVANKPKLCSFATLDFNILDALRARVM